MSFSSANFLVYSSGNKYIIQLIVAVRIVFLSRISFISHADWIIITLKKDKNYSLSTRTDKILTHSRSQESVLRLCYCCPCQKSSPQVDIPRENVIKAPWPGCIQSYYFKILRTFIKCSEGWARIVFFCNIFEKGFGHVYIEWSG